MPITDAYGDAVTYRGIFGLNDATKDASILLDLTAVSRWIDRKLGRFFTKDAAAVARIYWAGQGRATLSRDGRDLYVDDIAATAGLVIKVDTTLDGSFAGESAFGATDYELHPLSAALGSEAQPWTMIRIPPWSTKGLWSRGLPVQLTAIYGWPAVPTALARFTYQVTGIMRMDSSQATGRIPESIDAAVDAAPDARELLVQLMRSYGRPAGLVFS